MATLNDSPAAVTGLLKRSPAYTYIASSTPAVAFRLRSSLHVCRASLVATATKQPDGAATSAMTCTVYGDDDIVTPVASAVNNEPMLVSISEVSLA